jgi:hypothetical protein
MVATAWIFSAICGLGRVDVFQTEGQVLAHRHMRVERIGLEHHGQPAIGGGNMVDHLARRSRYRRR